MSRVGNLKAGSNAAQLARHESPTISTVSTDTEYSGMQLTSTSLSQGILNSSSMTTNSIRVDRDGTVILPGSKSHRVCFADELRGSPRAIAQVHQVESLKSFNFGNRFVDGENSCVCKIS